MKKIVLALAIALGTMSANAQEISLKEGDVIVEGMLGYNSTDDTQAQTKTSQFTFTPKAGLFVADNFAVGLQLGYGSNKEEAYGVAKAESKNTTLGIGAFGRYYFAEFGQRFKVYSELGVGYTSNKSEATALGATVTSKSSGFSVDAGLGFNYFVTPKMAINFGLTDLVSYNSSKPENGKATNKFDLNINNFNNFFDSARFGMTFKF